MAGIRLEGVTKRFGEVTALSDVTLDVTDGEFLAVLGPPGAGKTTLLRTIVGLETPEAGDVYLGDDRVNDVWPGDRDISIVFQNLALYPDKTVRGNLAFPLKQRGMSKKDMAPRIEQTAKILRIDHLLEMRSELKHLQRDLGRTLVYVTHDQVEAMSMPDRIAVLREGVIQQVDTPERVYHEPANRFVATVVGSPPMNFIPVTATWTADALEVVHPSFRVRIPRARAEAAPRGAVEEGSACWIGVRPEDVELRGPSEGVAASVYETEPLGGETVVDLQIGDRIFKVLAPASTKLDVGAAVGARLDPGRLHVFDHEGDKLLSAVDGEPFEIVR